MLQDKCKVFLASPISGFNTLEDYSEDRDKMFKLIDILEAKLGKVFYAGKNIPNNSILDSDSEIKRDFDAIRECQYFIMFYPDKIVSSVLVEAGYALALKKPSIYFVKNIKNLPFLLQFASREYRNVKLIEYSCIKDIINLIAEGLLG